MKLEYFPQHYLEAIADSFVASFRCSFKAGCRRSTIRLVYRRKHYKDKEIIRKVVYPLVVETMKDECTVAFDQQFHQDFIVVKLKANLK
jgi:hypothetical protein